MQRSKQEHAALMMRKAVYLVFIYLSVVTLFLFLVMPYLWMFISSISYERELIATPPHWFPHEPTLERYIGLITGKSVGSTGIAESVLKFKHSFSNSLIITSISTFLTLFLGALAAYAHTRFSFQGKKQFMFSILVTQMIPRAAIIIPLYLIMGYLGLRDTRLGLIIVYTGFLLPVVIWILRNYFVTIPKEIGEAAIIDGCSHVGALFRIILPLSTPALFATGAYTFLTAWNEFFFALILTSFNAKTITVVTTEFSTQGGINYGMMTTAGVIGSLVPVILAIVFQKYIIKGLTAGWT